MCVLMSATAPNSCKLAVYEGEGAVKKQHAFWLSHRLAKKNKKKNSRRRAETAEM